MKQLLAWTEVPTPRSTARPSWPWLRNSTLDRRSACRSPARVELCKSKRAPLGHSRRGGFVCSEGQAVWPRNEQRCPRCERHDRVRCVAKYRQLEPVHWGASLGGDGAQPIDKNIKILWRPVRMFAVE